ncbi:MAG: hypothetical protein ACI9KN_001958 [Gammaproteobacteria bacterium]|jgi:hypothetical protein
MLRCLITSKSKKKDPRAFVNLSSKTVEHMLAALVVEPLGDNKSEWKFIPNMLSRIETALSLRHNLGVNYAGAALAVELMEDIRRLKHLNH